MFNPSSTFDFYFGEGKEEEKEREYLGEIERWFNQLLLVLET